MRIQVGDRLKIRGVVKGAVLTGEVSKLCGDHLFWFDVEEVNGVQEFGAYPRPIIGALSDIVERLTVESK